MAFNSLTYLYFLVVVFGLYWWLPQRRWRNVLLLLGSYTFYAVWDWRFLSLILISSVIDFVAGQGMQMATPARKRYWLYLSLTVNLGLLGFFKYFGFFVDSLHDLLQLLGFTGSVGTLDILLPVGISFYTFQTLSYTIDVYRGRLAPTRNALAFFTYVAFFPQLVAGPIERATRLLPQFEQPRSFSGQQARTGLRLILYGLFTKLVIADRLAELVDPVYADPGAYAVSVLVLATVGFAWQIYADFSAYSNIAIGSARLLGFELMTNFRTPYWSTSLREFWQRWHISLSTWFRDYVYVPLGGNRVGPRRWAINILLTFLLSGLWHGAAYTFLVWGAMHGLALLVERWAPVRVPPWLGGVLTFSWVGAAWVFFRAESWSDAVHIWQLVGAGNPGGLPVTTLLHNIGFTIPLLVALSGVFAAYLMLEIHWRTRSPDAALEQWPTYARWPLYYGLLIALLAVGRFDHAPSFIYFQF